MEMLVEFEPVGDHPKCKEEDLEGVSAALLTGA